MASKLKYVRLEEAIDFVLKIYNSDCDTSGGVLSSKEEADLDCQLENNDNLED